jgi:hypothetical protein
VIIETDYHFRREVTCMIVGTTGKIMALIRQVKLHNASQAWLAAPILNFMSRPACPGILQKIVG